MTARLKIAEFLEKHPWRAVGTIACTTKLSSNTVRRELDAMEKDGLIGRRTRRLVTGGTAFEFAMAQDAKAKQGHLYMHDHKKVLALETGFNVKVAEVVEDDECWPVRSHYVCNANALRPLPMRYFHGQTPS